MTKADRQEVFNKCGGRCAYCGKELGKRFHVDHIVPIWRKTNDEQFERMITHGETKLDIKRGTDHIDNLLPSCSRCNGWKSTFDIETFRQEIMQQVVRARAYSCNFRMAEDFGLIKETGITVKFFFETLTTQTEDK